MISVVCPVYVTSQKQIAMTQKCLELARTKTSIPFEMVIIETCSDYFREYADIHIYEKQRRGVDKSIERAYRIIDSEYIAMLSNDVYVESDWLKSMLECFDIEDCGISTTATTQLGHTKQEKIEEGIWCPIYMIPTATIRKHGYDCDYLPGSWTDTDMVMNVYRDGKKMYRNHNCVVEHLTGQTLYSDPRHQERYAANKVRFEDKFSDMSEHYMYQILTKGYVV